MARHVEICYSQDDTEQTSGGFGNQHADLDIFPRNKDGLYFVIATIQCGKPNAGSAITTMELWDYTWYIAQIYQTYEETQRVNDYTSFPVFMGLSDGGFVDFWDDASEIYLTMLSGGT